MTAQFTPVAQGNVLPGQDSLIRAAHDSDDNGVSS